MKHDQLKIALLDRGFIKDLHCSAIVRTREGSDLFVPCMWTGDMSGGEAEKCMVRGQTMSRHIANSRFTAATFDLL